MSQSATKNFRHDTTYFLERGDEEFELWIEYNIDPFDPGVSSGPAEACYPPEGGGISDMRITLGGKPFEVTDDEDEQIMRFIETEHDHSEPDYYDDYRD